MTNTVLWWLGGAGILGLAALPVSGELQIAAAGIALATLLGLRRFPRLGLARLLFLATSAFLVARYLFWRTFNTLGYDDPASFAASLLLYGAEVYGIVMFGFSLFVNSRPIRRHVPVPKDGIWPSVDVFIPTYDEPVEVVKATLVAATAMAYEGRFQVYLLDDGGTWEKCHAADLAKARCARRRRQALQHLCRQTGARYLTRRNNAHAKAGNLNAALKRSDGELIAVLDCDHIPTRDFLRSTVGHFVVEPRLFLVQTPHFFVSPDPIEKNLDLFNRMPSENDMFYEAIQPGLDFWESSFFCGSAAVLRRRALEEVGGFSGMTITEDAETAISLHARRWRSRYLLRPMISGLQPETFTSFVRQRMRWAQGMVQILLLKRPWKRLQPWQRLGYLNCMLFWFFPFARVVFLTAPLAYLLFGLRIYDANLREIASYTLPYLIALTLTANYLFGRVRWFMISEIYESMQSLFTLQAILAVLRNPRAPKFDVTPKGERLEQDFISPLARPFYVLLGLMLLGAVAGAVRWQMFPDKRDLTLVTLFWVAFNLVILIAALGALYERRQRRHNPRLPADDLPATLHMGGMDIPVRIHDFSVGGAALKAASSFPDGDSAVLTLRHPVLDKRLAIPVQIVNRHSSSSQFVMGIRFSIQSLAEYRDIVLLVHGDSERWERILRRRDRDIGILKAVYILSGNGFRQAREHFAAALRRRFETHPPSKHFPSLTTPRKETSPHIRKVA
ncbi:cellulose synthase (UDP-forming) [Methylomarinovum tepidoasis]|uniref:Cellulose synthase catalytic subunit [UDP-forming] n=1 Tax=Methylomarinovum tepidoasis TaxID=2840183 RepID=A0AAU9C9V2_9GAMM|nr:UDP-forming cellulose synthase catalytic subunit [Methylomarinovum sp. IN45]BCX88697.1 cellulose synthase (UDP-forming) [Methylomarinovum sp. IN45]